MKHRYDIHTVPVELLQHKTEFCIDVARWLFEFSAVSYYDDLDIITPQIEDIGFKVKALIDIDNSECLITYNNDTIIVAFTGTEVHEWQDILTDIQFWHSKAEVGKVHTGFYKAYHKLKFPVYRAILELNKEKLRKIYWTGHSLGGALAVIFASYYKSGVVYTYGQPKVGDWEFSHHADKVLDLYRIVNDIDMIPPLPPSILGYTHCGTEVRFHLEPESWSFKWIARESYFLVAKFLLQLLFKYAWISFVISRYVVKGILYHTLAAYRKMLWRADFVQYAKIKPEEVMIFYRMGPPM
jgi:predicted lipase